ncbi:uncharacterized protein LOC113273860 [Papaver somniferum]|uniref:uncharacterized protein LOC113273860 n=1 Tax=Papaver somniferum TaxID=3469 RepID=UPI000E6FA76B|nr:uncharacterized protein LOC113273860 [Papaver somniferum]
MVVGKKETPHLVQRGKQLIGNYLLQSIISNIDLREDLTDAVKEFVKFWFKIGDSVGYLDQVWIEETIKSRDMVLLHVSGYFKEDQKAGYGVMIRDVHLRPIKSRKIKKQDMELRLSLKSRIWSYENGLIRCMLGVIGKDLEGFVFAYCNTCV